jgi:hypothetical protein
LELVLQEDLPHSPVCTSFVMVLPLACFVKT